MPSSFKKLADFIFMGNNMFGKPNAKKPFLARAIAVFSFKITHARTCICLQAVTWQFSCVTNACRRLCVLMCVCVCVCVFTVHKHTHTQWVCFPSCLKAFLSSWGKTVESPSPPPHEKSGACELGSRRHTFGQSLRRRGFSFLAFWNAFF